MIRGVVGRIVDEEDLERAAVKAAPMRRTSSATLGPSLKVGTMTVRSMGAARVSTAEWDSSA
jgi:hypothetical protein